MDNVNCKEKNEVCKAMSDYIHDTGHRLIDNIMVSGHKAVLLILAEDSETDNIIALAISYNNMKKSITDVAKLKRRDIQDVYRYIEDKLIGDVSMSKITQICDSKKCEYFYEDGIIYYIDEDKGTKEKIADINRTCFDKVKELFDKEKPCCMELKGERYLTVDKKTADEKLGSSHRNIYSRLSAIGFIFTRTENKKTRYSYREKEKTEGGKYISKEYFAVREDKYEALIKGSEAS